MSIQSHRFILFYVLLYLTSCSTIDHAVIEQPTFSVRQDNLFGERPEIINTQEIHRLSQEQKGRFLKFFNRDGEQIYAAHERVFRYMETLLLDFEYQNDTYTASEALERMQGNCLTLAIITSAFAKLVNVDIEYQLVDSDPVFELNDNVVLKGLHIRTKLIEPGWSVPEGAWVLSEPGLRIDFYPTGNERFVSRIKEQEYFARYYLNLAASAMLVKDYSLAYWFTVESLDLHPLEDAYNNLAITYRYMGKPDKAEEIYKYAIEHYSNKITLLKNFRILLINQGRHQEAEEIGIRINEFSDPSPFDMFHAARDFYDDGSYYDAIKFYEKTIKVAPYLHEAYLGLALSHYQLGNVFEARKHLQEAIEQTYSSKARTLYQAKLAALTRREQANLIKY